MTMATILNTQTQEILLRQQSLNFRIRLDIGGANIRIEDLDIDFDVIKTNTSEPNKSKITVWNINNQTFEAIRNKTNALELYTAFGADEYNLLFTGFPVESVKAFAQAGTINTAQGFLASPIRQDLKGGFDIPTIIETKDAIIDYRDTTINKTYKGQVTSTEIINDCIAALGVPISRLSPQLPVKTFNDFVAIGKVKTILNNVTKSVGAKWSINNGTIQIITQNDQFANFGVLLNADNSERPEQQNDDLIRIKTRLLPFLQPNDWVRCNYPQLEGTYRTQQVRHIGNNYGTAGATEVLIGIT